MRYNFIINPEIEKICEQKAKEEYELAKQIQARWPNQKVDRDYIIQAVKEEIYHKMLIGKPDNIKLSDYAKHGNPAKKAWYELRQRYAEDAVNKVMNGN